MKFCSGWICGGDDFPSTQELWSNPMLLYPNDVIHKRIAFSRERERYLGGGKRGMKLLLTVNQSMNYNTCAWIFSLGVSFG